MLYLSLLIITKYILQLRKLLHVDPSKKRNAGNFFRSCSEFTSKMESRAGGSTPSSSASRKPFNRSLSNSDVAGYEKNDGSVSDSALSSSVTENRKSRRPSLGYKVAALVGLSKKSSSTSQLPGQGGSEDAEDQSEAQYFPPEGHVTANMGASYEMSSFDSTVGSFDRTGSSFDGGMGSVSSSKKLRSRRPVFR